MKVLEYGQLPNPEKALAYLTGCDWSAGRFLASLIRKHQLDETMGEGAKVFFLMEGNRIVSFATLSRQDAIKDETLYPWIGFVYTDPQYRGHRYSKRVIDHALAVARTQRAEKVYLTTEEIGFYERYGFVYWENRIDIWDRDSRIYYYSFTK